MSDRLTDDELLALLGEALDDADPPPPGLREVAIRAATWDVELAELLTTVHDSLASEPALRSTDVVRDLVFENDEVTIELELREEDGATAVEGAIDPRPDSVVVQVLVHADREVDVDAVGRFALTTDAAFRLVVRIGDSRLRTPLIDL